MDQVRLPDLEVIRRYSVAVRAEHAPIEEVIEALRADLEAIQRAAKPARDTDEGIDGAGERPPRSPARAKPRTTRRR